MKYRNSGSPSNPLNHNRLACLAHTPTSSRAHDANDSTTALPKRTSLSFDSIGCCDWTVLIANTTSRRWSPGLTAAASVVVRAVQRASTLPDGSTIADSAGASCAMHALAFYPMKSQVNTYCSNLNLCGVVRCV